MSTSIRFFNESPIDYPLDEDRARTLFLQVMKALGKQEINVNIIIKTDESLREMKKQYFNKDVYTDIISFIIEEEPVLEGELYCSLERIRKNAAIYSEPEAREFARILIHGACHLCGYEDNSEEERREMTRMENAFLNQFYNS